MLGKSNYLRSASVAMLATMPVILGCALLGATGARAATCAADPCDPYVIQLDEVGNNVVATGSGEFNTMGLTQSGSGFVFTASIAPNSGVLSLTPTFGTPNFVGFTGPSRFGPGPGGTGTVFQSSNNGGPTVAIMGGSGFMNLPSGYTSGDLLAPTIATWNNQTIASLGVTPGDYVWTWGSGAPDQSLTICTAGDCPAAPPSEIPAPAALPLFATGLGALGLLGWRKKRRAQAVA